MLKNKKLFILFILVFILFILLFVLLNFDFTNYKDLFMQYFYDSNSVVYDLMSDLEENTFYFDVNNDSIIRLDTTIKDMYDGDVESYFVESYKNKDGIYASYKDEDKNEYLQTYEDSDKKYLLYKNAKNVYYIDNNSDDKKSIVEAREAFNLLSLNRHESVRDLFENIINSKDITHKDTSLTIDSKVVKVSQLSVNLSRSDLVSIYNELDLIPCNYPLRILTEISSDVLDIDLSILANLYNDADINYNVVYSLYYTDNSVVRRSIKIITDDIVNEIIMDNYTDEFNIMKSSISFEQNGKFIYSILFISQDDSYSVSINNGLNDIIYGEISFDDNILMEFSSLYNYSFKLSKIDDNFNLKVLISDNVSDNNKIMMNYRYSIASSFPVFDYSNSLDYNDLTSEDARVIYKHDFDRFDSSDLI